MTLADEPVDLTGVLRELAGACRETLAARGVAMELLGLEAAVPAVRGSRDRLRQVMEHLLNNAAQAIAAAAARDSREEEAHRIRLTVSHDERAPERDRQRYRHGVPRTGPRVRPLLHDQGAGAGAGLGLSICYGIVREHGGEISAFNLHPRGAAVVVELPLRKVVRPDNVVVIREEMRA